MKATKEQIAAWKKAHGDVWKITVDGKTCFLKKPNRKALAFAATVGAKDPVKFNEVILNAAWIEGDEEIKTDDSLFFGVSQKLGELVESKEAELEKL